MTGTLRKTSLGVDDDPENGDGVDGVGDGDGLQAINAMPHIKTRLHHATLIMRIHT